MPISHDDLEKIREAVRETRAVTLDEFEGLQDEVKAIKDSVEALVNAWKAAGVFVGVVKWVAGVVAAIAAAWAAIISLGSGHH